MGMAASQARYLALTARKSNVEYEGQQINQERTALANQSANTFNELLALEVPTAPSTTDYTEIVYSYTDGTETETISSMTTLSDDADGYNYLITHYHYADVYTGVQNKLSNPQVVVSDSSVKSSTSRSAVDTVEESNYTVEGYEVSAYDAENEEQTAAYNQIIEEYAELADVDTADLRCYTDSDGAIHFTTINDLSSGDDITDYSVTDSGVNAKLVSSDSITATAPENATYTVNGNVVSAYDASDENMKAAYDQLISDYPSLANEDISDLRCYTDSDGNIHFTTQADLEGTDSITDYYIASGTPTYVGNCELSVYDSTDAEQQAALAQILEDWPDSAIAAADESEIYVWTYQNETRFACLSDLLASANSAADATTPTENQSKLTYYTAKNINTKIQETEKAMVDLDESGRAQSIRFEDSSATYSLTTETVTDEDAYEDAMNEYNYNMAVYEKAIADINAKTEKIQEQDKTLELKLRQLDTEQEALQTEMEAVQKVIEKNIESTFKTFE